jgi:hypothetical protein
MVPLHIFNRETERSNLLDHIERLLGLIPLLEIERCLVEEKGYGEIYIRRLPAGC